jgi:sugar phosphate isomerase/epimerase
MLIQRREFLAATSALALAPFVRSDEKPFGEFLFGCQSYTFRKFTLEQAVGKIQACGLGYVEFFRGHVPTNSTEQQIATVLKLCKDHNVQPIAFGVERFSKDHEANKKLFAFAKQLGVKSLSADPDPDSFNSLDKLCEEYKIAIAIHPHGPSGKGMHRWADANAILKAVKDHHALIGTCLDTGHLIRSKQLGFDYDPVAQIKVMGHRNFSLHLKDHDNARKEDVVFGDPKGKLDVKGVLKALKEVKFGGSINIEYEAKPEDPTEDVKKCVAYLKEVVKGLE